MPVDADRLIQLAAEMKSIEQRRDVLLAELQRMASGAGGSPTVVRHGPGRPLGLLNQPRTAVPAPGRTRRKGMTSDIVDFLKQSGGARTAGEIVAALGLPKTKSSASTVSTTLVRLAKEGRAKKDAIRGYRAA